MLRPSLLLLPLLANAMLLAANMGWLDRVWPDATLRQREPERLERQLNPGQLQLLPPGGQAAASGAAAALAASAGASVAVAPARVADVIAACVQAGPLSVEDLIVAERALLQAGVAPGVWRLVVGQANSPASAAAMATTWLVVMGRYSDPAVLQRKQEELRRLKVDASTLSSSASLPPGVAPGLLLGRYNQRAAANEALAALAQRGVNSARVVAFQSGQAAAPVWLQLPAADEALQARLAALPMPNGRPWQACDQSPGSPPSQAAVQPPR